MFISRVRYYTSQDVNVLKTRGVPVTCRARIRDHQKREGGNIIPEMCTCGWNRALDQRGIAELHKSAEPCMSFDSVGKTMALCSGLTDGGLASLGLSRSVECLANKECSGSVKAAL